jgi:Domain of unknown function (DUF1906)
MIIDYSVARPTVANLKAHGVTAVGRYIGWDSVPGFSSIGKNITAAEAKALLGAGIDVFLAFEYAPDAAAHGTPQGTKDGQLATKQLGQLGAPPTMGVYFAVDFDIPDYSPSLPDTKDHALKKLGPVGEYFQAIKDLKPAYDIGVYGGYYAVKRVLDAGLATLGWQTVAWSGGQRDTRAVLYQTASKVSISGVDEDIRENGLTAANYGQWSLAAGTTSSTGPSEYSIHKLPPGRWTGMVTLNGIGTDGAAYHTTTADGESWSTPRKS